MTSGVTTLAAIRAAAVDRADMPTPSTSTFITTATWNNYINASWQELYGILAQAFGSDYYVANPFAITTDGTNYLFALPSDFFKLEGVDLKLGGKWTTLKTFAFGERNRGSISNNIPTAGLVLQAWYFPRPTLLAQDADTLDGVNGWEEYIVTDSAIKALEKEESDASMVMAQKQALKERIQEEADRRDAAMPAHIVDSQRANAEWPALFYGVSNLRYRLSGNNLWLKLDDSFLRGGDY